MSDLRHPPRPQVRIAQHTFLRLLRELERRSQHRREAGAFLLAPKSGQHVTMVAYYDDLDPTCLTGGITFHPAGYTTLNQLCRDHQVHVLADIHLHPGHHVQQSSIDAAHPMVARAGHLALIAPRFAQGVTRADQLGAHLKITGGWHTIPRSEVAGVLVVGPTWRGRLMKVLTPVHRLLTDRSSG